MAGSGLQQGDGRGDGAEGGMQSHGAWILLPSGSGGVPSCTAIA
jgi:hypothetical protein